MKIQPKRHGEIINAYNNFDYEFLRTCNLAVVIDNDGNNILHHMAKHLDREGFEIIMQQDQSSFLDALNSRNKQGKTPLHMAATTLIETVAPDHSFIDYLISLGADTTIIDNDKMVVRRVKDFPAINKSRIELEQLNRRVCKNIESLMKQYDNNKASANISNSIPAPSVNNDRSLSVNNLISMLADNDMKGGAEEYSEYDPIDSVSIDIESDSETDDPLDTSESKDPLDTLDKLLDTTTEGYLDDLSTMSRGISVSSFDRLSDKSPSSPSSPSSPFPSPSPFSSSTSSYETHNHIPSRMINPKYDPSLFNDMEQERPRNTKDSKTYDSFLEKIMKNMNVDENEARLIRSVIRVKLMEEDESLRGYKGESKRIEKMEDIISSSSKLKKFIGKYDLAKIRKELGPDPRQLHEEISANIMKNLGVDDTEARFIKAVIGKILRENNEEYRQPNSSKTLLVEMKKRSSTKKKLKELLDTVDLEEIRKKMEENRRGRKKKKNRDSNRSSRKSSDKKSSDNERQERQTRQAKQNYLRAKNNRRYLLSDDMLNS